jgi:ribonuclease HI
VLNRDLWEPLLELIDSLGAKISWHNVGGHVGIGGNERVDEIASGYATGDAPPLYSGARGEYPIDLANIEVDASLHQKKSESRSRSKAKAYSYVSEVDGIVEVHKTWAECEARVRGKRARFKKALTAEEEREIVVRLSAH